MTGFHIKKAILVSCVLHMFTMLQAQVPPTSIILGTIDKPFKGHLEVFVKKNGIFKIYGRNNLYDNQRHYAVAIPAGKEDTVQIIFIKNAIKSTAFNDTVHRSIVPLREESRIYLPLIYQASTKKYIAAQTSTTAFTSISAADSVVLIYCALEKSTTDATTVMGSYNLLPDEKASVSTRLDKNLLTHIIAFAMPNPGIVDLECSKLKTRLYVNPGETIRMQFSGETTDSLNYEISNPTTENKILKNWFQLAKPVSQYGHLIKPFPKEIPPPETFIPAYEKTQNLSKTFLNSNQTKNQAFNNLLTSIVSFDLEYSALVYLTKLNNVPITKNYFGNMYAFKSVPEPMKRFAQSTVICDNNIASLYDFKNFIHLYARLWETMFPVTNLPLAKDPGLNEWQLKHMCTKESKAVYLYLELSRYKRVVSNVNDFAVKFEPFEEYMLTDEMETLFKEVYNTYYLEAALINTPIKPILLPDSTGKMINLSTAFKGKVVVFDLWSTSCLPCRAQIPYWNTIAEEYRNNPDVVFVAISLERDKEYWINHWKEVIRESKFNAMHLLDVEGKSFWKPNNIGNYCYMLLGKDGKWIDNRCPKPEYKDKLKKLIDNALAAQ